MTSIKYYSTVRPNKLYAESSILGTLDVTCYMLNVITLGL